MLQIGLTGGIGSGKSTVAALFRQHGAFVIDSDAIARELTAPRGAAVAALQASFGPHAIDAAGGLDRAWMRQRAFADPAARQRLEGILHPMITAETERLLRGSQAACTVFDVPLLVESGRWRQRLDRVLVVDCSHERQIDRVQRRSGWSRAQVQRVIDSQASRATRRAAADAVLDNDGVPAAVLARQAAALWAHWTGRP